MSRIDGEGNAADFDHLLDDAYLDPEDELEDLPVPDRRRPPTARPKARIKTPKKDQSND